MFRKIIVRLFLCFFVLIGSVVLAVGIAGYLAIQRPAFYAELRDQAFSKSDQIAANGIFQDVARWSDRSIALQRSQLSDAATPAIGISNATVSNASVAHYDPIHDTFSVTFTQKQINAQFAANKASVSGQCRNPRIRIGRDRIDVACEVVTSKVNCVLSAELKPTVTADGRLRLDLLAARIGQLPIPLRILSWLPRNICHAGNGMDMDLTAPTPYFCLNVSDNGSKSPAIKAIQCKEGEITMEFGAPILKRQQNEVRTTAPALSVRD